MSGERASWAVVPHVPGRYLVIPFSGAQPIGAVSIHPFEADARRERLLLESTARIERERAARQPVPESETDDLFGDRS